MFFLKEGKEVDRMNVGNYDRIGLHALLTSLGLKRHPELTYEKLNRAKEMEKFFANPDLLKQEL